MRGAIPECPVFIESNNAGIAVVQDLRSEGIRFNAVNQVNSKVARSVGLSACIDQSRVIFKEAEWNKMVLTELNSFTWDNTHAHDDMIDAIVLAFNKLKFGNSKGISLGYGSLIM